jgi:hypothetical protein
MARQSRQEIIGKGKQVTGHCLLSLNINAPCHKLYPDEVRKSVKYVREGLKPVEIFVTYLSSIALYGAETWSLRKGDQKHLESFEMWCWRRMEKISSTDRVRNEEVLHRVKEERNILHTIKRRKANCIGHILRRNCLLKHVIEGKLEERIEMTGRRGRRRKQLLHDLKEKKRYWKLKEEALNRTLWRIRFGRGYGPVVRQNTV